MNINKNNKNKRGFTIVELVIVIAVVAILSAVLIPTFSSLIKKANVTADQTLVRNLNTSLAIASDGKNGKSTMYETLNDLKGQGYDITKLSPTSAGSDIVWDSNNNQFVLVMENGKYYTGTAYENYKEEDYYKLWKIYTNTEVSDSKYSVYLSNNDLTGEVTVNGVGFDAGENTGISKVTYNGNTVARDVVVRTNGGELVVDGEKDTIYHYGAANGVEVIKCAMSSYHVFAKVSGTINVQKGHIDIEENGSVSIINVKSSNSSDFSISNKKGGNLNLVKAENPEVLNSANVNVTENTGVMSSEDKDAVAYSESKGFLQTWVPSLGNGKTMLLKDLEDKVYNVVVLSGITATFDLNGHKFLTDQKGGSYVCGNMTFMDSSADQSGLYYCKVNYSRNVQDKTLLKAIGQDAVLTIESGNIEARNGNNTFDANNGQFGIGVQDGGNIIMNGGTIKAGWYAIAGSGSASNTGSSSIIINGGKLISVCDYAIYLPHAGTTEINGGVVDGAAGAICINRGSLVINGGTLSSNGTGDLGDWGDGTGAVGNKALIIVNAKYGDSSVVVNGGTYRAEKEIPIFDINSANKASITISAGTYNQNIGKWVTSAYDCVDNNDGTWTVVKK